MCCLVVAIGLWAIAPPVSAEEAGDWQQLFDGKTLDGWHANFDADAFKVVDGVIRIQGLEQRAAHLFYVGDTPDEPVKFKNFELKVVARAEPKSNSGVFVHTSYDLRNHWRHLEKGYEVQLNSAPEERLKTGSLYAIVDVTESPVDESEWFTMLIRVEGKHIVVTVDGKQVIDYTEPEDVKRPAGREGRVFSEDGGAIALQAHDPQSVWYFKEVAVRALE
jgi:hypothetical protein